MSVFAMRIQDSISVYVYHINIRLRCNVHRRAARYVKATRNLFTGTFA